MNAGLLPGFGRSRQRARRIVGMLASPQTFSGGAGYAQMARAVTVQSGSATPGVFQEYLNIRGGGRLLWLATYGNTGASRNVTTILEMDGATIVNNTASITSDGRLYVGGGINSGAGFGAYAVAFQPIEFSNSLRLTAAGDLLETNGFTLAYTIELWE